MTGVELLIDAKTNENLSRQVCEDWVRYVAKLANVTILAMVGYDLVCDAHREPGVSVVALIAESHIALHTWPEYGVVNLSMYSCVPFDAGLVATSFLTTFGAEHIINYRVIKRFGKGD